MWLPGTTVTLTKNCYVDFALDFVLTLALVHVFVSVPALIFAPNHILFRLNCDMMVMLQKQINDHVSINYLERKGFMERTLTYKIDNSIPSLPVSQFLRQKGFSTQNLTQLKKDPAAVLANGVPCFMNHVLQPEEVLTIHILEEHTSEKIPPVDLPLDIVYEDEDLMVIHKPAGMPIHPSMNNYYNSLANGLAYYFAKQNCPFVFRCINRLDRDTSGLTLIAKHSVSGGMLSTMIANKTTSGITREYLAIVKGSVTPPEGTITAPLARKEGSIIERCVDFEKGENAITHYKVLDEKNGHSLVSLILETGRTHQIRIHMKYLGYPLIGDYLYNPDMAFIRRQALHAWKLSFRHPITGEELHFTAPLPEDMEAVGFSHILS